MSYSVSMIRNAISLVLNSSNYNLLDRIKERIGTLYINISEM